MDDNPYQQLIKAQQEAQQEYSSKPIQRNATTEKATWDLQIAPIIRKHNLKDNTGRTFEYRYVDKEINIDGPSYRMHESKRLNQDSRRKAEVDKPK